VARVLYDLFNWSKHEICEEVKDQGTKGVEGRFWRKLGRKATRGGGWGTMGNLRHLSMQVRSCQSLFDEGKSRPRTKNLGAERIKIDELLGFVGEVYNGGRKISSTIPRLGS